MPGKARNNPAAESAAASATRSCRSRARSPRPGGSGAASGLDVADAAATDSPLLPGSDTRDRLIEAARVLFLHQGYEATSIKQILRKADANSGSLYHYFPAKEDLLLAVLDAYKHALYPAVVDPVFERCADPIERIFGILDGYRQMLLHTDFQHGCPIGNLAIEVGDAFPEARQLIAENFIGWTSVIRRCLDDAAHRLPAQLDRSDLADFVLTVMEGAIMQARTHRAIRPYELAVAHLRNYFEHLLDDSGDAHQSR